MGISGVLWQYAAIDAPSNFTESICSPENPQRAILLVPDSSCRQRPHRRWPALELVTIDHGSEFRDHRFDEVPEKPGATHALIRPVPLESNGCVEGMQHTILEECWKPTFGRYLIPKYVG